MSVNVNILSTPLDSKDSEYKAAQVLKQILDNTSFGNVSGEIIISSSLTMCGQKVRDLDILLAGRLDNYVLPKHYTSDSTYPKRDVVVKNFCVAIELKEHDIDNIKPENTGISVFYNGKKKNATGQNEKQRYALARYFSAEYGYDPIVTNFLWLKNVSVADFYGRIKKNNPIGALPTVFSFNELIDVIIAQGGAQYNNVTKTYNIQSSDNPNFIVDLKALFKARHPVSGLTRKKVELLIQSKSQKTLMKGHNGSLKIYEGKAGTGKTFLLLEEALTLANEESKQRCIILTYNHALVGDISRLLHFMEVPDGIDNYTIQISTLHSFFMELMKTLGISTDVITFNGFNETQYQAKLKELKEFIIDLMNDNDIQDLISDNQFAIDWDYVMIDEAQDWSEEEKEILIKVYGASRIIVADGLDQFIRSKKKLDWSKNLNQVDKHRFEKSLRQKTKLVSFANAFASKADYSWNVKENPDLAGGRILVYKQLFPSNLKDQLSYLKTNECDNYDMLILVPNALINKENHTFKNYDKFNAELVKLFDGTNAKNRESYPTSVEQARVFHYESCRGLEGWVTICMQFDTMFEDKYNEFLKGPKRSLALESKEDEAYKNTIKWMLMPLTRAMDTLILTIKDEESKAMKIIKQIADETDGLIEFKGYSFLDRQDN